MNHAKQISQMLGLTLLASLSAACATSGPIPTPTPLTPTAAPPAVTPIPPAATTAPVATAAVSPIEIAGLKPPPLGFVSMAYDSESERAIQFGGMIGDQIYDSKNYNGETWAYDIATNRWTLMDPASGPTPRAAVEIAYDAESDRIILHGGSRDMLVGLSDTWAYDYNTNTWTEMSKGPASHLGARMVYDEESDRIVLFGGWDGRWDMGGFYNDTRVYDFNSDTWKSMAPSTSPPARNFHAMAYDSESDRVIVWGGDGERIDDSVWSYDFNTNTWQEARPGEGPHPRRSTYSAMVYDAESDRIILFGGTANGAETWAYDYNTNTWTNLEPDTVAYKATGHALVYSAAEDLVILFGGSKGAGHGTYTGETWIYDPNANMWTKVTMGP